MTTQDAPAAPDRQRVVSVLDVDRELVEAVPAEERALARRTMIGVLTTFPGGAWVEFDAGTADEAWGFYVHEGVLVRVTALGGATLPELLGPREIASLPIAPDGTLPVAESLCVVEPASLVVLGRHATQAMARWPALHAIVERRRSAQRRRAVVMGTIAQLPRVEIRLLATLWHLADVWGRPTADGTALPFPLTHEMLGNFVAAQRPTVTLAVQKLCEDGHLQRLDDGSWLLPPASRTVLAQQLERERPHDVVVRGRVNGA